MKKGCFFHIATVAFFQNNPERNAVAVIMEHHLQRREKFMQLREKLASLSQSYHSAQE